ncbi:hypothetical protein [Pilimelia anulata]|nr:hypothetical protein [Pilimelia anulata]
MSEILIRGRSRPSYDLPMLSFRAISGLPATSLLMFSVISA